MPNQSIESRHDEARRLIALARDILSEDEDELALTYLGLALTVLSPATSIKVDSPIKASAE